MRLSTQNERNDDAYAILLMQIGTFRIEICIVNTRIVTK